MLKSLIGKYAKYVKINFIYNNKNKIFDKLTI